MAGAAVRAQQPGMEGWFRVAGSASLRRARESIRVALAADHAGMRPGEREAGFVVVKGHLRPAGGDMAGRAVFSKFPAVVIIAGVTGVAVGRGAFEGLVGMAGPALNLGVRARQRECRFGVVEGGRFPGGGRMAQGAVGAQAALMGVIPTVAAGTAKPACPGKGFVFMAVRTGRLLVSAG